MTTWNRTSGDTGDTIVAYLYGVTGTAASSVSHVWANGVSATTLSATTVSGADSSGTACLVHTIQLGSWLQNLALTARADYFLEHQITFADGRVLTWQGDAIRVSPQGA